MRTSIHVPDEVLVHFDGTGIYNQDMTVPFGERMNIAVSRFKLFLANVIYYPDVLFDGAWGLTSEVEQIFDSFFPRPGYQYLASLYIVETSYHLGVTLLPSSPNNCKKPLFDSLY